MRHKNKGRALGRKRDHRKSMLNNMSISILKHGLIKTTLHKAKEVRMILEPLITISKIDNVQSRRLVKSRLNNKRIMNRVFNIGKMFKNRCGGYLRIIKCGFRKGDAAPMAIVELVEKLNHKKLL